MLDISIKQLTSKYKTSADLQSFMQMDNTVEHKTDGVKLTLVKVNDTGIDDWLVSYKGTLFYRGEFSYQGDIGKQMSIGNSQFDVVFDHLERVGKTDIPLNTELFIEFLVKKVTVMSDYASTGQMILIGYGTASPVLRFGKVRTNSGNLITEGREKFAKALQINVPYKLHQGPWFPTDKLIAGCKDHNLQALFEKIKPDLKSLESTTADYYNLVCKQFLTLESQFGGKEEGIVVINSDGIFKVQQTYQLDQEARTANKVLYMEDNPVQEQAYWDDVLELAEQVAKSVTTQNIQQGLKEIADIIKKLNVKNTHSKKNEFTIRDDIQVNAKNFYLKNLRGNNGALVLGKFRVLTNGHVKMIEKAIKESDEVVIGVVTGSRTKDTNDLRLRTMKKTFPNLKVVDLYSGNVFTAFKKADININTIYCGTDRVADYSAMLAKAPGIKTAEIERTNEDISASKVIENIRSEKYFKDNTPKSVWGFYPDLLEIYDK